MWQNKEHSTPLAGCPALLLNSHCSDCVHPPLSFRWHSVRIYSPQAYFIRSNQSDEPSRFTIVLIKCHKAGAFSALAAHCIRETKCPGKETHIHLDRFASKWPICQVHSKSVYRETELGSLLVVISRYSQPGVVCQDYLS